ncbi:MAG: nitronate monooxygenase, partial [Burkholderiales bacterium]|nr:nitronate monooxygenase [Burkholderiales bacterium]
MDRSSDETAVALQALSRDAGLRNWRLKGVERLPVIQGGMGVGVSAGRLAGTVAGLGGMGTISAVDLRRLHPDLMARTAHLNAEPDAGQRIDAANLEA